MHRSRSDRHLMIIGWVNNPNEAASYIRTAFHKGIASSTGIFISRRDRTILFMAI